MMARWVSKNVSTVSFSQPSGCREYVKPKPAWICRSRSAPAASRMRPASSLRPAQRVLAVEQGQRLRRGRGQRAARARLVRVGHVERLQHRVARNCGARTRTRCGGLGRAGFPARPTRRAAGTLPWGAWERRSVRRPGGSGGRPPPASNRGSPRLRAAGAGIATRADSGGSSSEAACLNSEDCW